MGIRLSPHPRILLALSLSVAGCLTVSQYVLPAAISQAQAGDVRPEPVASPTPQPSAALLAALQPRKVGRFGRLFDFLKCEAAKKTKTQELSDHGPEFSRRYDESKFSLVALVRGGWVVAGEFELDAKSFASITFEVMGAQPFSETLKPRQPDGGVQTFGLELPNEFGDKLQPALITFKALADGPNGVVPADFQLNALGIGAQFGSKRPTSMIQPNFEPAGMNAFLVKASAPVVPEQRSFHARLASHLTPLPALPGAVNIERVDVDPTMLAPAGKFQYTFVSSDNFSRWNADYYRLTREFRNGRYANDAVRVAFDKYNELVFAGLNPRPPRKKSWSISRSPKFPPGNYKIQVTVFLRADGGPNGGKSAYRSRLVKIN